MVCVICIFSSLHIIVVFFHIINAGACDILTFDFVYPRIRNSMFLCPLILVGHVHFAHSLIFYQNWRPLGNGKQRNVAGNGGKEIC